MVVFFSVLHTQLNGESMVSKWVKEGDPKVLAENHGKCLMLQTFVNPETGEKKDYSLFYGRGKSAIV